MIKLIFAGLWASIWHWGFIIGLLILCLLGAFFSPIARKDFIWAAVTIVLCMLWAFIAVRDYKHHVEAQGQVVTDTVNSAVQYTGTPAAKRQKDRWDNPKY